MQLFRNQFAAGGIAALASLAAFAPAQAACVTPTSTSAAETSTFLASPNTLLSANPTGGGALIGALRQLATSDRSTIAAIGGLIPSANEAQRSAIGSALAQAAAACARSDQDTAREIQRLVAGLDNKTVTDAYTAVTGDPRTAATGGAGGGAGGGGGSLGGAGVGQSASSAATNGGGSSIPVTIVTSNSGGGGFGSGSGASLGTVARRSTTLSVSGSN